MNANAQAVLEDFAENVAEQTNKFCEALTGIVNDLFGLPVKSPALLIGEAAARLEQLHRKQDSLDRPTMWRLLAVTGYLLNLVDKVKGDLEHAADAKALFTATALQQDLLAANFPDARAKPEDELSVVLDPLADMVRYIKALDSASHFPKPPPTSDSETVLAVRRVYAEGPWFTDSPDGPSLSTDIEPAVTARGLSLAEFDRALRYLLTDSGLTALQQEYVIAQERITGRMWAKFEEINRATDLCLGRSVMRVCFASNLEDLPPLFEDLLDEFDSIDVPDKPLLDRNDINRRRHITAVRLWKDLYLAWHDLLKALDITRVALSEYRTRNVCPIERVNPTLKLWYPEILEAIPTGEWSLYPALSTIRQLEGVILSWLKRCAEVDASLEVLGTKGLRGLFLGEQRNAAVTRLEEFLHDFDDLPIPSDKLGITEPLEQVIEQRLMILAYLRKFATR